MANIDIRKSHDLRFQDARQRANDIAADMAEKFSVSYRWENGVILFDRTGIAGEIRVSETDVQVSADLGLLLISLKPMIEQEIHRYLNNHFP